MPDSRLSWKLGSCQQRVLASMNDLAGNSAYMADLHDEIEETRHQP
jgi:hypothetical protein